VNFNGTTSPGTIRAQYNVSSVTKNATGDYTVNFTTAMADSNYSVIHGGTISANSMGRTIASQTTSSVEVESRSTSTGILTDDTAIHVAIFGN